MSVKNKQDYARLHGYDFYVSTAQTSPLLSGAWNKVALILELVETSQYEWIVWIDSDSLIMNVLFEIPWKKYEGYDLVMWGQEKELYEIGNAHMGLNTGVFLVRNTEWSKSFLREVSKYGLGKGKHHEDVS